MPNLAARRNFEVWRRCKIYSHQSHKGDAVVRSGSLKLFRLRLRSGQIGRRVSPLTRFTRPYCGVPQR